MSEVIIIVLLLLITVSMASMAFVFLSSASDSSTTAGSSYVSTVAQSPVTSFKVEGIDISKLYIRNLGEDPLTNLRVYVNDELATYDLSPSVVQSGKVGTLSIFNFLKEGDLIKIASPSGFSATKLVLDPCDDTVLCLKFDEGSGTNVYDSSPGRNNFRITGMPNISWTAGASNSGLLIGSMLSTSCVNQGAAIVNNATLTNDIVSLPFTEFSVSMMIKYASSRTGTLFHISTNQSGTGYNGLWAMTGTFQLPNNTFNTSSASFTNTLSLNSWHHIVYVFDNVRTHTHYVYADGVKVATANLYGSYGRITGINIGTYAASCEDATSGNSIDEFRIYNKAIY